MSDQSMSGCGSPNHWRPASRREFLYVGLVGGLGLTLGQYLGTPTAMAGALTETDLAPAKEGKAKSVINIFLPGGIASQESFDPKPFAPIEYRGPLGVVKSRITGEVFSEHLKQIADVADKITVIRSMTHGEAAHERGTHNMFTGYRPSPAIQYPSFGSVISEEFGPRKNMPPYVCIPTLPNPYAGSGYLSSAYGPFSIGSDPASGGFAVRDLALANGIDDQRFERRKTILAAVDDHFRKLEKTDALAAMDTFYQRAYSLISSPEARESFNLKAEPEAIKEEYGKTQAGMRLLLARRLVEGGVRFVSTVYGGWDHHENIQQGVGSQMPPFDKALAALIRDLDRRNLLDSTLVMVTTEFGRSPKINQTSGRDHWPKVFSVMLAGGGIKRGSIYGSTDATATEPDHDPLNVEDFAATLYHQLGINPNKRLMSAGNRPIDIVRGGRVINELLA
ncbi:MAG TPA: DUF1501 domain-containing protein [Tepidisphaeraceae bacterium]|jgi:hypothetical protein